MKRLAYRLVVAQSTDALTFAAFMVIVGPASVHTERNPLVGGIYALGGFAAVGLVKLAAALIVGARSQRPMKASRVGLIRRWHERHPSFHPRLAIVMLSIATASGIAGAGLNTASLIDTLGLLR